MHRETVDAEARLEALAAEAKAQLAMLSFATKPWVRPRHRDGRKLHDVVIVGGGQSGLVVAHALLRAGVHDILVLDAAPRDQEGVWESFARMHELRSPKDITGQELGAPALTFESFFIALRGRAAWDAITRAPRRDWAAYLRWYRKIVNPPFWNDARVTDIAFDADAVTLAVERDGREVVVESRFVVLATGLAGGGDWVTPRIIAESLPRERYNRTSDIFDGEAFRGRRVGVLGAGAAAYDVAVAMLDHGATSVEMFMRRPQVPLLDIAREFETVGHLQHYPEMADATKWAFAVYVASLSQSPATHHFYKACAHPAFTLHGGAPWLGVGIESGDIVARTPKGAHRLDHVFIGAGMATDMLARPELRKIAEVAALWRDRFTPPPEDIDSPRLANPYLGPHFEFTAREPGGAPGLDRILAFNGLSMLSLGPMSSVSVSGHKYGAPRLVRGVTSRLWAEQEAHFVADLRAFQTSALVVPPRIAAMLAESTPRYGT